MSSSYHFAWAGTSVRIEFLIFSQLVCLKSIVLQSNFFWTLNHLFVTTVNSLLINKSPMRPRSLELRGWCFTATSEPLRESS